MIIWTVTHKVAVRTIDQHSVFSSKLFIYSELRQKFLLQWKLPHRNKNCVPTVIDGLGQDCSNSIALAMELPQFCTQSLKYK